MQNVGFFDASGSEEPQIHASRAPGLLSARTGLAVNSLILDTRLPHRRARRAYARLAQAGIPYSDYREW